MAAAQPYKCCVSTPSNPFLAVSQGEGEQLQHQLDMWHFSDSSVRVATGGSTTNQGYTGNLLFLRFHRLVVGKLYPPIIIRYVGLVAQRGETIQTLIRAGLAVTHASWSFYSYPFRPAITVSGRGKSSSTNCIES